MDIFFWSHLAAGFMMAFGWLLIFLHSLDSNRFSTIRIAAGTVLFVTGLYIMIFGGIFL